MNTSYSAFRRHFGLILVLAFWAALAVLNVFDIAPSVKFRGMRFSGGDFGQYFMGGVVANEGIWGDLYPKDISTAPSPDKATITTRLAFELSKRKACSSWKYIYPPPLAVFLAPLDWLPFTVSRRLFTALLFGAVFWFLVRFRRGCDDWNLPSRLANLLILVIGTGLPVCESVMFANATPFIALSSLLALRSLRKNNVVGAVFSFALAGLFKGVSAVWIPALFLWRRWRILVAGLMVVVIVLALPHILGAPLDLWGQFLHDIIPGSRKLYWIGDGNLGLPSFFAWLSGEKNLPFALKRILAFLQLLFLILSYALAWRVSRKDLPRAEGLSLFVSTIVFQIFSPICWPHYAFNVAGFLPLALSMAGIRSGLRLRGAQWVSSAIVALAFILAWYPIGNAAKYALHIPALGFGRTFGYLLMLAWGFGTLIHLSFRHE